MIATSGAGCARFGFDQRGDGASNVERETGPIDAPQSTRDGGMISDGPLDVTPLSDAAAADLEQADLEQADLGETDILGGDVTFYDAGPAHVGSGGAMLAGWPHVAGSPSLDTAYGVATDGAGNVYVTGSCDGPIDLGGGSFDTGSRGLYVASYTAAGAYRWHRAWPHGYGRSVAASPAGEIVVGGYYTGAVDFGDGPLPAEGNNEMLLLSLSSADGSLGWSWGLGSKAGDSISDLATDSAGNIYFIATANGRVDLGGGSLGQGGNEILVASFDSLGAHRWSRGLNPETSNDGAASIAVGNQVYIAGTVEDSIDPGGGLVTSPGGVSAFLVSYAQTGTFGWAKALTSAGTTYGFEVMVDAAENLFLVGSNTSGSDVGGAPLPQSGGFWASYDSVGQHRWSRGTTNVLPADVALADGGRLVITGTIGGLATFGALTLDTVRTSEGALTNMLIVSVDSTDGAPFWARRIGGPAHCYGRSVATFGSRAYVVGIFDGPVEFDTSLFEPVGDFDLLMLAFTP